jgi:hypothetical protein
MTNAIKMVLAGSENSAVTSAIKKEIQIESDATANVRS